MSFVGTAAAVVGAGAAVYGAVKSGNAADNAQRTNEQALADQKAQVAALQYKPINIEKITADAHNQAVTNATQSLQLEKQLNPGVASARAGLQDTISKQLALGGKLDPDTINEVTRAAEAGGGSAGLAGSSLPLTAARLGQSSQQLMQQREANASSLLAGNQLPETGISPGSLADLQVANTNALNQFNLSKLGANANLANSTIGASEAAAKNASTQAGLVAGLIQSPTSQTLLNRLFAPAPSTTPTLAGLLPSNVSSSINAFGSSAVPSLNTSY